MNTNFLNWFSGKSLENARAAVALIEASVAQGSWVKGASRKVHAALSKTNVAAKWAKAEGRALETAIDVNYDADEASFKAQQALRHQYWEISHCMYFGAFQAIQKVDFARLQEDCVARNDRDTLARVTRGQMFALDFAEVAAVVGRLDATKPVPVFTLMNASPTVSAELKRQGAVSVAVCPMKYEQVERQDKTGQTVIHTVVTLLWPAGIQHDSSRYLGNARYNQCQACGHAIKNAFNWVPLVLTTDAGEKKSLWVGRDCAKTLFGVDMTGDLELKEGR